LIRTPLAGVAPEEPATEKEVKGQKKTDRAVKNR
jgi:hypothetical protein